MVVLAFFLAFSVLGFGVFYFRLHSLPEHLAHKSKKIQAELVALLCLISLFTHQHIFWIIALVLAFIELPDFGGPLNRIAGSAEKLAGFKHGEGHIEMPGYSVPHEHAVEAPLHAADETVKQAEPIQLPVPEAVLPQQRGRAHA